MILALAIRNALLRVTLCSLSLVCWHATAAAADTLHVIIVADTNDEIIGKTVGVDSDTVAAFFSEPSNVPSPVNIVKIQGEQFTQKHVLDAIQALPQGPANRYLFYYVGHGASDLKRGHHFVVPGQDGSKFLSREAVLKVLLSGKPKLTLLISDCCSDIHDTSTKQVRPTPRNCKQIVQDLFYDALDVLSQHPATSEWVDNVVNINSCSEKQVAAGADGGYFTNTLFYDILPQGTKLEEQRELSKRDGFVTWRELFPLLVTATERAFVVGKPRGAFNLTEGKMQLVQTPQAFQLPGDRRDPQPPWYLGVKADRRFAGRGARIEQTKPGSVASLWLEPGDVIVKVNGITVRKWTELDYQIDASNGSVALVWERAGARIEKTITLPFYEDKNQPKDSVEIEINAQGSDDDYVTWAPTLCRARIRNTRASTSELTVFLTNDHAAAERRTGLKGLDRGQVAGVNSRPAAARTDGDVLFAAHDDWLRTQVVAAETLQLSLPANGSWVTFVIVGKFGRPSSNDRDAIIEVHLNAESGPVVGTRPLMVRVRKAAHALTDGERERFLSALFRLRQNGTLERFHHIHAAAGDRGHNGPVFLPWHRAFLLEFERELQAIDPSVSVPYIDWMVSQENLATVFSGDFLGQPATQGAVEFNGLNLIARWRYENTPITRGQDITKLSLAQRPIDPMKFLRLPEFGAGQRPFWRELEDQHGQIHSWIGGWMSELPTATQDPIFYLHQCYVDRMWATWQHRHNRFGKTRVDYDSAGVPADNVAARYHRLEADLWPWDDGTAPQFSPIINQVWPAAAAIPKPSEMIDYLGLADHRLDLGFCYDDVPYGVDETSRLRESPPDYARSRSLALDPQAQTEQRIAAINQLPASSELDNLIQILLEDEPSTVTREKRSFDGPDIKTMTAKKLRGLAFSSVGEPGRSRIDAAFRNFMLDPREELRNQVLAHLMARHDRLAADVVTQELKKGPRDEPVISRVEAIGFLSLDSPLAHLQSIRPFLSDAEPLVRVAAVRAIGSLLDLPSDKDAVTGMLQDEKEDARVRAAALRSIEADIRLATRQSIALIRDTNQTPELQQVAINTLAKIVSNQVRNINNLQQIDHSSGERLQIVELLRQISGPPNVQAEANKLVEWMEDHDPALR